MKGERQTIDAVRAAAARLVLFLPHAVRQMLRPERLISREDVMSVVHGGTVIEEYTEDVRGGSCLVSGVGLDGRRIHVVCAPKEEYLAVITAYVPDAREWSADFSLRRKE